MLKVAFTAITLSIIVTSCANQSDHEALQAKLIEHQRLVDTYQRRSGKQIKDFQNSTNQQVEQLNKKMKDVKNSYSPEAHAVLKKNITGAKKYNELTLATLKNIQDLEDKVKDLPKLSQKNTEASNFKNAVTEFNKLKESWTKQSQTILEPSLPTQKSSEKALDLAVKSEKAAKLSREEPSNIRRLKKIIDDLEDDIRDLERSNKADCNCKK